MTEPAVDLVDHKVAESALIVEVPEVADLVARWRLGHDPSATLGVPAHVTVLFPFVEPDELRPDVLATVAGVAAAHPAFEARFVRVSAFPTAIYLDPEPDAPFRALTADLASRFPDHPPYEGRFDEIVPHLTVAIGDPEDIAGLVEVIAADLTPRLPIATRVSNLELLVSDGHRWHREATWPLGG